MHQVLEKLNLKKLLNKIVYKYVYIIYIYIKYVTMRINPNKVVNCIILVFVITSTKNVNKDCDT